MSVLSPPSPQRSKIMASVKSRDTTPEKIVARNLRRIGVRFKRHARSLPGCPDFYLQESHTVLFVHGCFWHAHSCSRGARIPRRNRTYWIAKREKNQRRDAKSARSLRRLGISVLTVWECELREDRLPTRVVTRICNHAQTPNTGGRDL